MNWDNNNHIITEIIFLNNLLYQNFLLKELIPLVNYNSGIFLSSGLSKNEKSNTKEISKVTDPNMASYSQRKKSKIEIEINENPNYQFSDERTDRKRRKHINQSNNNLINPNNIKKIKTEKNFLEKSGSKFASGSNFNLMKLECGVDLTENRKKKSGGKNYFEKYGKFSFELYQSKLNNTMSDNFMVKGLKEMMDNSIKEED